MNNVFFPVTHIMHLITQRTLSCRYLHLIIIIISTRYLTMFSYGNIKLSDSDI